MDRRLFPKSAGFRDDDNAGKFFEMLSSSLGYAYSVAKHEWRSIHMHPTDLQQIV